MSFHDAKPLRIIALRPEATTDVLVATVCRSLMAGFSYGQTACVDHGWQAIEAALPLAEARSIFGEFHHFVRTLLAVAVGPINWRPPTCRGLSEDEARMLEMIAAAQCSDRCQLQDVAAALLRGDELASALESTQSLANALAARDLFVGAPLMRRASAFCQRPLHSRTRAEQ